MAKNWQDYSAMTAALASGDDILLRDKSDTTDNATEGTVLRMPYAGLLGLSGITPGGRLTLESGVPVSTTDQTAKGTLYYTPYLHDFVRIYDGTRPTLYTFTERSLALTLTSGKNYDVFLYNNSGTLTLELSAAWTNDTTRADALAWQAGVGWVKSGTATRLWLGTIRASASNQTELVFGGVDTAARCLLWNAYNRVSASLKWRDSVDSYTYTTGAWRQKNGSANNQANVVCGAAGCVAHVNSLSLSFHLSASRENAIGLDSTSASATGCIMGRNAVFGAAGGQMCSWSGPIGLGHHYVAEIEACFAATGTATWYGDIGTATSFQSGAVMRWEY